MTNISPKNTNSTRSSTAVTQKSATAYSCMGNMTNVIRRHSSKIQKPTATTPEKKCNCRKKDDCPLDGACLTNNLVYKAVVTAAGHGNKEYIGMTEHELKTRFNNH